MTRAQRRRVERIFEKELRSIQPAAGVGLGWRYSLSSQPRPYRVREHKQTIDVDKLEQDSLEAIEKHNLIVPEDDINDF